jgi:HdeA/HdeB family
MKTLIAFFAVTVGLLGEAAAEEQTDRIDLNRFTCKQFLEMNRDDALIVVGWLQGYHLDEHAPAVVDFVKLSVESVSLANRCVARPDEDVMTAAEQVFGK